MQQLRWTDEDFEAMSWHDCHVHSMRIIEGLHGSGELELDIDYILEWKQEKNAFSFVIVPATLCFHEVSNLRMSLDWATPSMAFGPFAIDRIERTSETRAQYTATMWRLGINWPFGEIGFEAVGFTQRSWGSEVVSPHQVLRPEERIGAPDAAT